MADGDVNYGLVDPFDADDGQLDDVKPSECFALGVEWAMFRSRLATGRPFTDLVLANNAARLEAMAERHGRFAERRPEVMPGWVPLTVGGSSGL